MRGVGQLFLIEVFLYEQYFSLDGQKLFSLPALDPFLASQLGGASPLWSGQKTINQKVPQREVMVEWVLELPVSAASIRDINTGPASGCNAALVLINQFCIFFLCWLARGEGGWRRLVMEEHILYFWNFFFPVLKKNYLLKQRDGVMSGDGSLSADDYKTSWDQQGDFYE